MKGTKIIALAVSAALLGGCSTGNLNPFGDSDDQYAVSQPSDNSTAVKDQQVNLVLDEGIKLNYTILGDLKSIEVNGVVESWKGTEKTLETLARTDALERLTKYLYGEQVDTVTNVEVISRTLDKARDNALNRVENGLPDQSIAQFSESEIVEQVQETPATQTEDNTSRRIAERVENTVAETVTTIKSGGRISGFKRVGVSRENDGQVYVFTFKWVKDEVEDRVHAREMMSM